MATWEPLITLEGHTIEEAHSVVFSPDSGVLACASYDTILFWMTNLEQARAFWQAAEQRRRIDRLLDLLFEEHLWVAEVVAALQLRTDLDPMLRGAASRRAHFRGRSWSSELNSRAWTVVDPDGQRAGDPIRALRQAQAAVAVASEDAACRDTLAWALFANERYEEALAESQKAYDLAAEEGKEAYRGYLERLRAMIAEHEADAEEPR